MIKNTRCRLILFFIFAFSVILVPNKVFSGSRALTCDAKFPVILAHGTGGADKILGIVDYWWGIPEALEEEGAEVYVTRVNGLDGTIDKAVQFKNQVLQIKAISCADKFNIIGHSHGALYARYAISNLGLYHYVRSLTSIAGPHRGMSLADILVGLTPKPLQWLTGSTLNFVYAYFCGDSHPDSLQNVYDVTRSYMQNIFNPGTPDIKSVYYQSWAARAKTACPNIILEPARKIIQIFEGPNDGLVGIESAKWGDFRGVEDAAWWSPGCDHLNIIGQMFGFTPGFDAPEFYMNIVSELKNKGF